MPFLPNDARKLNLPACKLLNVVQAQKKSIGGHTKYKIIDLNEN